MQIIDEFAGGSLNDVVALEDRIIKKYSGQIDRGFEKLHAEYQWFLKIPPKLTKELPYLFPQVLDFKYNEQSVELHMSRILRIALSKAILQGIISPDKAQSFLDISFDTLLNRIYTIRQGTIIAKIGYIQYHSNRLALARKYLRKLPYMYPILNSAEIIVNGISCPSINQFLSWLDLNAKEIFISEKVKSIHGNFHLDNILIDLNGNPNYDKITFIDPRGDLLGYPHYDIGKLLITLEGYYDEIHYGGYKVKSKIRGNSYDIDLEINQEKSYHYQNCIKSIVSRIDEFSKVEGVSIPEFLWLIYTTECIHILSFCFYHAYRLDTKPDRIQAFIAVFALLARRLLTMWDDSQTPQDINENRLKVRRMNDGN